MWKGVAIITFILAGSCNSMPHRLAVNELDYFADNVDVTSNMWNTAAEIDFQQSGDIIDHKITSGE
jgi:hypothetical protein